MSMPLKTKTLFILVAIFLKSYSLAAQKHYKYDNHREASIEYKGKTVTATYNIKEKVKTSFSIVYYWYDNNTIHNTKGGYDKYLLDGEYVENYYPSSQLKKKGEFYKGTMDGVWYEWYKNGVIKNISKWKKGVKHGQFLYFSDNDSLVKKELWHSGILKKAITGNELYSVKPTFSKRVAKTLKIGYQKIKTLFSKKRENESPIRK